MKAKVRVPTHLRKETKVFWSRIVDDFELEEHHLKLLTAACESWDRATDAREAIAMDGPFFKNRHAEIKPHPGLAVERDSRGMFARLILELALDVTTPEQYTRLPRLGGGS